MKRTARTPETARYLGISPRTMEKWRITGGGPPYMKVNGLVLYDLQRVDEWLEAHVRRSTSEPDVQPVRIEG